MLNVLSSKLGRPSKVAQPGLSAPLGMHGAQQPIQQLVLQLHIAATHGSHQAFVQRNL
jgi:hypothetical protein